MIERPILAVLPNRRLNAIATIEWRPEVRAYFSVGFDDCGKVREVFASLVNPTQWLDLSFADAARMISHLLQEGGFDLAALHAKLSAVEPEADGIAKPSVPRWLIEHALSLEREEGDHARPPINPSKPINSVWEDEAYRRGGAPVAAPDVEMSPQETEV